MSIKSNKAKYLIENEGVPTCGGLLKSQMNKTAVVKVVEIAEEEMKERCCIAFRNFMLRATLANLSKEQLDFEEEFKKTMTQI